MASRNSMLEKILEDFPNCNSQSNAVKNESSNRDLNDFFNPSNYLSSLNHQKSFQSSSQIDYSFATSTDSRSTNRMNSHTLPDTSLSFINHLSSSDKAKMNSLNLQLNKSQNVTSNQIECKFSLI